jgi:predicted ATP-dependent endonuclease of OLD family
MKLEGFGISNFRSFDSEGVNLDDLKKINIIIGKNNSGKSNVLRFLQLLNFHHQNLASFPFDLQNQHKRNGEQTIIKLKVNLQDLIPKENDLPYHHPFKARDFTNTSFFVDYILNTGKVKLPEFITSLHEQYLVSLQRTYSSAGKADLIPVIEGVWNRHLTGEITRWFKDLIYIPHFRVIQEGHNFGDSNSSINGSNIISKMFQMQNPVIGDEASRNKFELIRSFVRELINKTDLEIEIPHTKEGIVLTIDGNRLPLESFGTGIHQLVLLCSTLVIHENALVCIEEPEIHLHPELQRKFINFLNKTKNAYFITTHSNIFLDSRLNTSVYHVENDGIKSSVQHANRTEASFVILNDLGYHSSDILQANGVIWVEGPSDRTFLLKWLNLTDSSLIEGLHFIIMFYGGRLLSHLSFSNEKITSELIPLLKLNRNAFVIMDRDGFSSTNKLNETKRRIKLEIGENNCWITKGREIENYLTENTLTKWLSINKISIDLDRKLEDTISKKHSLKYNLDKTNYSKEIVKNIDSIDLDILDLRKRLAQLTKAINTWNS